MKKQTIAILLILICAIYFSVRTTYAYYVDSAAARAKLEIANWIIRVNSEDITLEAQHDFSITEMMYYTYELENGEMNSNDKFAPGMEATFMIALDATDTKVALEYDLGIDISQFDNPNISIVAVDADGDILPVDPETGKYHGSMDRDRVQMDYSIITVYLRWDDSTEYQEEDNRLGDSANKTIKVPVDIVVNQLVGA